jgi:actin-related protein 2
MICDETTNYRSMLELSYPLREGIVNNWDDMSLVWDYAFQKKMKLGDLGDKNILLTEAACNPKKNRIKMADVMFNQFGFGGITFEIQALLSLFCEGLTTGLVMDSGDGVSHTIPVSGGYVLDDYVKRLNVAGAHVTTYLGKLLLVAGYAFNSSSDYEILRNIKETACYVSYDIERDRKLARETCVVNKEYRLPDKKKIMLGRERFEAAECLFNPMLVDVESPGIPEMIFETIIASPMDCRAQLYNNIVLSGGSTMFPGYPTRVTKDLWDIFKQRIMKGEDYEHNIKINVKDSFRRKHSVFTGGSVLAQLKGLNWITKATYEEEGDR